jgi:pyruvate kinase
MANTVGAPLLVFSKKGGMPALLSHYRPNKTVFAFTGKVLCVSVVGLSC